MCRQKLILVLVAIGICASAHAKTYPQLALGGGYEIVLLVSNTKSDEWRGKIALFTGLEQAWPTPWSANDMPMAQPELPFQVAGNSSLKIVLRGDATARAGYLRMTPGQGSVDDDLTVSFFYNYVVEGALVDSIGVQQSTASTVFLFNVEKTSTVNTGLAWAPDADTSTFDIKLTLFRQDGSSLPPVIQTFEGHKAQFFDDQSLFPSVPNGFSGYVLLEVESQVHFVVLRLEFTEGGFQLTSVPADFPETDSCEDPVAEGAGSQMFFLLDSGLDISGMGFTPTELQNSVQQLTGTGAVDTTALTIDNLNSSQAVTLRFSYFSDSCESLLQFLVLVPCGDSLTLNPFDYEAPGTGFNVKQRLFGPGTVIPPITAEQFGAGRFVLMVTAVGAVEGKIEYPPEQGNLAPILYPRILGQRLIGTCGVNDGNLGAGTQQSHLSLFNSTPIAFDYLDGWQSSPEAGECRSTSVMSDDTMLGALDPIRTYEIADGPFGEVIQHVQGASCGVVQALIPLGFEECPGLVGPVVVRERGEATGTLHSF
jgi:hypothetical protein